MSRVPTAQGGTRGRSLGQLRKVDDWIDQPSQRLGSWHGRIRHNPTAAAKVFSGNGTVDPAALNKARLHKIQDISHNTRPIDGWNPAPLRAEADDILKDVTRTGRLPEKLPDWVDEIGPLRRRSPPVRSSRPRARPSVGKRVAGALDEATDASDEVVAAVSKAAARSGDDAARAGAKSASVLVRTGKGLQKVAVPVAIAVELAMAGYSTYRTEADFAAGRISSLDRRRLHCRTGARTAGGAGGAWAGAAIGTAVCPGAGTIVGVIVGGVAGDWLLGNLSDAAWHAYGAVLERERHQLEALQHALAGCSSEYLTADDWRSLGLLP